jgi:hypothetical protein
MNDGPVPVPQVQPSAEGARNFSQCDSMLIGDNAAANTYPYIQVRNTMTLPVDLCFQNSVAEPPA